MQEGFGRDVPGHDVAELTRDSESSDSTNTKKRPPVERDITDDSDGTDHA